MAQSPEIPEATNPLRLPAVAANSLFFCGDKWTAQASVAVYDSWDSGQQVAKLTKGDQVTGMTGGIVTYEPGIILINRDFPDGSLKRGDHVLTYAYYGEGVADAWYQGRFHPKDDLSFASWQDGTGCRGDCFGTYISRGKNARWAQVRLTSGTKGWVDLETAKLDGVCTITTSDLSHIESLAPRHPK